jgi:sulfur-carrier protein adenylyltransferase/sulfurtransferase
MLTNTEKNRYDRHIKLSEVGLEGQGRIKASKVLVIGAGGLGCPVLQYLTAAGVGTIGVIDDDVIDESNLQRQVLFGTEDVGQYKVSTAIAKLKTQNPFVLFKEYKERLTTQNALGLFQDYDIIVDGTDNFSTRYLINDACIITNKPLVYGSIYKFEGQISVFNFDNGPSYRCLFPSPPKENLLPNCSEIGVLGVLPGVIGTLQATEVLKIILQRGTVLSGRLKIINILENTNLELAIQKNGSLVKQVKETGLLESYELFCEVNKEKMGANYTIDDIERLLSDENVVFIDVRDEWEQPRVPELNALEIPLEELEEAVNSIPKDKIAVVFCQSGGRSQQVVAYLERQHKFTNLHSLQGGIMNYIHR